MGIKNLLKLINSYPDLPNDRKIEDFSERKVAIDISILLYQVVISIRNSGSDLTNNRGEITSHILGLFNKTIKLLEKKIIPVYVFDGKPPELKKKVLDLRKTVRVKAKEKMDSAMTDEDKIKYFKRSVIINKKQLQECRNLLELMGVPYVDAPEEADSQCAWLCKNGLVDSVLTEDMDILTFGSPSIVRNLTSMKKSPVEIKLEDIKEKFGWSDDQFIEMCILFGCDYCDHIVDIHYLKIFQEFQKSKNIDKVLKSLKREIKYSDGINYFKNPIVNDSIENLNLMKPNLENLEKVLINDYGLIKYKLQKKIKFLDNNFNSL